MDKLGPLISIVIPTYRRADLLAEAIASVLTQTFTHLEVIVVDDDGADIDTIRLMSRLKENSCVRYIRRSDFNKESGSQICRNLGISNSTGRYLLFLDDDDILLPHCLEQRIAAFSEDPSLDFCVGQCLTFKNSPSDGVDVWCAWTSSQDDLRMFLENDVPWQTSGPLWKDSFLRRVGDWDVSIDKGQDYEFHVRALCAGGKYKRLDVIDYAWRRPRTDSMSSFESFKASFKNGTRLLSFEKALDHVGNAGLFDDRSRLAVKKTAFRYAISCRLYGGSYKTAMSVIKRAYRWRCISPQDYIVGRAMLFFWFKIFGRIPAMTLLKRYALFKKVEV